MQRLTNDQLAERARAANRRRSERQRAKRMEAGKTAFTVWIPANLQKQIVDMATAEQVTTSAVAERLFITGINALAVPPKPADSVDAKPADASGGFNQDLAAFKAAVINAWNGGVNRNTCGANSYGAVVTELTKAGFRNSNGNPYSRDSVRMALIRAGLVSAVKNSPG